VNERGAGVASSKLCDRAADAGALSALSPADAAERLASVTETDWALAFADEFDRQLRARPLQRLLTLWGVSAAGGARLFGVSRQGFAKWLRAEPPADRAVQIADLAAATDLLDRYLRRDRIPAVVRRPAEALGGRSLLEMACAGESAAVLAAVRQMFDLRRVQP
jgi:hypothetical protein